MADKIQNPSPAAQAQGYIVYIPGESQPDMWDAGRLERNKEQLFADHPEAVVVGVTPLSAEDSADDGASYSVYIPGERHVDQWDGARLARNRDALLRDHPDAQVSRLSPVDYWGERLAATNKEISGLTDQEGQAQDGSRADHKARKARLKELYNERAENPAYQRQAEGLASVIAEGEKRLDELLATTEEGKMIEEWRKPVLGESPLAYDMRQIRASQTPLGAARAMYKDAMRSADAPSRYGKSGKGLGNFWRGIIAYAPEALPSASLLKEYSEGVPLKEVLDKIHAHEAEGTDLADKIMSHPEQMDYLTPSERELWRAFVVRSSIDAMRSGDLSLSYQAGMSAVKSLGFSADFLLAGGLLGKAGEAMAGAFAKAAAGSGGKALARNAAKLGAEALNAAEWSHAIKGVAGLSSRSGLTGLRREIALALPKFAVGTGKAVTKSAIMTPLMPSTYASITDSLFQLDDSGDVDLSAKAIWDGVLDAYIENYSELAGSQVEAMLGAPLSALRKTGLGKAVASTPFSKWPHSPAAKLLKQAGWNGFVGEMGEEWLGNAVRVITQNDPDALKNFATVEQQLITAGSFLPMSLGGAAMSGAQYKVAERQMTKAGNRLAEALRSAGYGESQIADILDVTKAETPATLGEHLTPAVVQVALDNGTAGEVFDAAMRYAQAVSRWRTFDGIRDSDIAEQRQAALDGINAGMGGATPDNRWMQERTHTLPDGGSVTQHSVRMLTDGDGNDFFVQSVAPDGTVAAVDRQGSKHFISDAGAYEDTGELPVDDFLDMEIARRKSDAEKTRMDTEAAQNRQRLSDEAYVGREVNIGTAEQPVKGIIRQYAGGKFVVQAEDGSARELTEEQMAEALQLPYQPQTDEQTEDAAADELARQQDLREQANEAGRGKDISGIVGEEGVTLLGITEPVTDPQTGTTVYAAYVRRTSDGTAGEVALTEEQVSAIAGMEEQRPAAPDAAPAQGHAAAGGQEEASASALSGDAPLDFRGNPLPMRTNKKGEQVVSESTLWNNDPEAWCRYNDANPKKKVDTKTFLESQLSSLTKELEKTRKALQKEALNGMDEDKMDKYQDTIDALASRIDKVSSLLNSYNQQAEPGMTFAGERRKAEADKKKEAAKAGFPGIQQRWGDALKIEGAPDEIRLANGETISGHYVLTEAAAPTPSHSPADGFRMTDGFPVDENGKTVNDRDYEHDKAAQQAVVGKAASYDQRALQTPVIVSADGVVLSGNDRTMASQIAAAGNTDSAYTDYLAKYPQKYGFTAEQTGHFQHPRVVFVPDEALSYDAATFAKFNAEEKKSQNKTEKAVKVGKTVTPETLSALATLVDRYDDVNALYNDADGVRELLDILLSAGVVTPEGMAALRDGDKLSGAGMDLLESALVGSAMDEEAVRVAMNDPAIRKPLVSAIAQIIANNTIEGYTLRTEITDAVLLVAQGKGAGEIKYGASVQDFIRHQHLFMDDVVASATVQMLADAINDRRTSQLKKVLALYNKEAEEAASGQVSLLTQDVPSREYILQNILEHLGYDTRTIFDTSEREAEQRTAEAEARQGGNGPEEVQADTPVQGEQGSTEGASEEIRFSNEVDDNGRQFVLTPSGELAFGQIDGESGLTAAPILLSEGLITNPNTNDGYGLVHIEARHGEEIRNAGYKSVLDFIEKVAKGYDVIREGNSRRGHKTYRLQLTDAHNNTLMVELSNDGAYWNINTAGIFKDSYGKNRPVVYNRHTTDKEHAETPEASQEPEQSGTTGSSRMNAPAQRPSASKVTENPDNSKSRKDIQGFPGRTTEDIAGIVRDHIAQCMEGTDPGEFSVADIRVVGSRANGTAKEDSDLDILVQYDGSMPEDGAFNLLNDTPLVTDGVTVDINPINTAKSGTADEWIERHRDFGKRKEEAGAQKEAQATSQEKWQTAGQDGNAPYSIRVENDAAMPKSLAGKEAEEAGRAVAKSQQAGKRRDAVRVKAGFEGNDLYLQTRGLRKTRTFRIAGARALMAAQVNMRIDEGIGITMDEARLLGDVVNELYQRNGLPLTLRGITRPLSSRVNAASKNSKAEDDAAEFPYRDETGQRYRAAAIRTDSEGKKHVMQFEGERTSDGESAERRVEVLDAPEEATMAVFSPNGVIFKGYAARNSANGEYSVWDRNGRRIMRDGKPERAGQGSLLTEAQRNAVAFVEGITPEEAEEKYGKRDRAQGAESQETLFGDEAAPKTGNRETADQKDSAATGIKNDTGARRIEDFGEKIGDARKDRARSRIAVLRKMSAKDISANKKADEIFPKESILSLYKEGRMKRDAAIALYALNQAIRPASINALGEDKIIGMLMRYYAAKITEWDSNPESFNADTVANGIEDAAKAAAENTTFDDSVPVWMREGIIQNHSSVATRIKKDMLALIDTYMDVWDEGRAPLSYVIRPDEHFGIGRFWVIQPGAVRGYKCSSREEALNKLHELCPIRETKPRDRKKDTENDNGKEQLHVVSVKKGAFRIKSRRIKGDIYFSSWFATREIAEKYLADNIDALSHIEAQYASRLDQKSVLSVEREGADYRDGHDVTEQEFLDTFGIRGAEFGNWVSQKERQPYLNTAYDALMDLASIIGVSPKALSLGSRLGIGFGSRGRGGSASAHYETGAVAINLTRTRGVGALAHEWFHALDNYLAHSASGNMSEFGTEQKGKVSGMRKELSEAFATLMEAIDSSPFSRRSKRAGTYWNKAVEKAARAFELYVEDKLESREMRSPMLAKNMDGAVTAENDAEREALERANMAWPYPYPHERESLNKAFDNFFGVLQEKTDPDGHAVLFQRIGAEGTAPVTGQEQALRDAMVDALQEAGIPVIADSEGQRVLDDSINDPNSLVKFQKVSSEEQKRLDSEPTMKLYRTMALIDGKLYPPMSSRNGRGKKAPLREPTEIGVWEKSEENPENVNAKGQYVITKENGDTLLVAYNPYFHASNVVLNDQFSSAYKRPNLVVVEAEIPKSELSSGYHAEKAKDAVGTMDWHKGPVASKLPKENKRTVTLSRWMKVTRILPDSEVAEKYIAAFKGKNFSVPDNTVTPSLRRELEKRGVEIERTGTVSEYEASQALVDADVKITDKIRLFRTKDGEVYGFTMGGRIYIDPRYANAETPIHEYTHLWSDALRAANPKEWENVKGLLKGTWAWDYVKEHYTDLTTDDEIADEALAQFSGKRGAEKARKAMQEALGENPTEDAKSAAHKGLARLKEALEKFWSNVCDLLHVHFTSAEEVADKALGDMLHGYDPREEQRIVEKAKSDGTYLKAPNGKPTNLSERQWVQVRTRAFKKWFGDWEKAARIKKLRQSKPVEVEFGNEYPLERSAAKKWAKANLKEEYRNADTGERISVSNVGINEVLSHGSTDEAHLKSIKAIPEFIEKSVYIDEIPNSKGNDKYDSYKYYVCGVTIDGEPYTAKIVVGVKGESRYYDHRLSRIEKGSLLDTLDRLSDSVDASSDPSLFAIKDTKLLSILKVDSSNAVDENGEPLAAYHANDSFDASSPDIRYMFIGEKGAENSASIKPVRDYDPRAAIAPVRGKWTKEKIVRRLKDMGGSYKGVDFAARLIAEFDSPEELASHMFYHGTAHGGGSLKPSILMSDREVERAGGGGYGQKYWGVSVSRSKNVASRFGGMSSHVTILPVVLAKNAKVIEMPDAEDAADLDEHITELWERGVDAVWIGDKDSGEQELCVINPRAMVNIDRGDYYRAYRLGTEENPLNVIDEKGIEKLYGDAKQYLAIKRAAPRKPVQPSRLAEDLKSLKPEAQFAEEKKEYERAMAEYLESPEYKAWEDARDSARRNIFFRQAEDNAPRLDVGNPLELSEAVAAVNRLAKKLGLRVVYDRELEGKGAYTEGADHVRINLANCESVDDAIETLLHEGVAHFGLREMLGEEGMKVFISDLLAKASPGIRAEIERLAAENGWDMGHAAEEYVAGLAQKTDYTKAEHSFWREILQAVRRLISRITGRDTYITEDVIREMLVASYGNLEERAQHVGRGLYRENPVREEGETNVAFAGRCMSELKQRGYKGLSKFQIIYDGNEKTPAGDFNAQRDIIRIFASPTSTFEDYEGTFFHENLHAYLAKNGYGEESAEISDLIEFVRDIAPDEIRELERELEENPNYKGRLEKEEAFVRLVEDLMQDESANAILAALPKRSAKLLNDYFKSINYDAETERIRRSRQGLYEKDDTEKDGNQEARVRSGAEVQSAERERGGEGENVTHYRARKEERDGIEQANARFNAELQEQIDGTQEKGHVYQLGRPGAILRSAGFPDAPIELSATHLAEKASAAHHPFDINEVKDLVRALNNPVAVFAYGDKAKAQNVIVEIRHEGKNFVVGVHFNQERDGITVSSIRGLYPKDNAEWLNWISQGKALYIDKSKIQTLIDQQRRTLADVDYLDLDSVTKLIDSFENPNSGSIRFRTSEAEGTPESAPAQGGSPAASPASYSRSMAAKRLSASETARKCGVSVELVSPEEMPSAGGKPTCGYWHKGKIYVCLENCRDAADVQRTILHEAVGHNGLRRLIGNENMRSFCLNLFRRLPAADRKAIADAATRRHGGNIAEAVEEYLAGRAEDMDFEDKSHERGFWDTVLDCLRKVLAKVGITIPLTRRDVRWLLWQSYNANKMSDILNEARRQVVARKLGFTLRQQADGVDGLQAVRFRRANDELDLTNAQLYDRAAGNVFGRLKESFADMYQSLDEAVKLMEKSSGKKAEAFENPLLALNQQSSKALAALGNWDRRYNRPMQQAVLELMQSMGGSIEDVERYVMLKHGLERNEAFAKRDAKAFYKREHEAKLRAIAQNSLLGEDEKRRLADKEKAKYRQKIADVEAGKDSRYLKLRTRDYSGLSAFYSEYPEGMEQRDEETDAEYAARLYQSRRPRAEFTDADGNADLALMEQEARRETGAIESAHKAQTDELWRRINAATKKTLKEKYEANVLSRAQYEELRDMFQHYVPLRGFDDKTAEDFYDYYSGSKGAFIPPVLKAKGRDSRAASPFGYIAAAESSAVAQNAKNDAKLALYYFISNRPGNGILTLSEIWYEQVPTDAEGNKVFQAVYPSFPEGLSGEQARQEFADWERCMQEKASKGLAYKGRNRVRLAGGVIRAAGKSAASHAIPFKLDGRDMMMLVNANPRIAQAVNGELNYNAETDGITRWLQGGMRLLSSLSTQYNPEFWVSNLQRDLLYSLMSTSVKEDKGYQRAFRKNLAEAARQIITLHRAYEKGTIGDSEIERLYKEFVDNGGVTGYTVMHDNAYWERQLKVFAGEEKEHLRGFYKALQGVSDFGEAIEQATRFAAFKTSREQGKDLRQAVADAKEVTVNFNRKGSGKIISVEEAKKLTWGKNGRRLTSAEAFIVSAVSSVAPLGRRFIMFFNASIQGLGNFVGLFRKDPAKAAAWAGVFLLLGAANAALHAIIDGAGDDDDKGKYLDIPDWERRNNALVGFKGAYLKWALPQEVRVFYGLGDMAVNHALGRAPHKNIVSEFLNSALEVSPVNPAEGVRAFVPSALVPLVDIVENKDYKGARVYNEHRYYDNEQRRNVPRWRDPLRNTSGISIAAAKVLNAMTGGDDYQAGWLNADPNILEHLWEGYTGGLGTTAEKAVHFVENTIGGDFKVKDTPFLRRMLVIGDERYRNAHTADLFYYYRDIAERQARMIKEATRNGDSSKLDKLYESKDYEIMAIYNGYRGSMDYYDYMIREAEDERERQELADEQDALRSEMIQEISELD